MYCSIYGVCCVDLVFRWTEQWKNSVLNTGNFPQITSIYSITTDITTIISQVTTSIQNPIGCVPHYITLFNMPLYWKHLSCDLREKTTYQHSTIGTILLLCVLHGEESDVLYRQTVQSHLKHSSCFQSGYFSRRSKQSSPLRWNHYSLTHTETDPIVILGNSDNGPVLGLDSCCLSLPALKWGIFFVMKTWPFVVPVIFLSLCYILYWLNQIFVQLCCSAWN